MHIFSSAFEPNTQIPAKYSKRGGNVSPPLTFNDIHAGAKSFALVCHDPDAPRADGFTHWVVWNIPADATGFDENNVPKLSVQGKTDWGNSEWGGPQPPSGTHRYNFYLYALDTMLNIPASSDRLELEKAMNGHVLATAVLTGLFSA